MPWVNSEADLIAIFEHDLDRGPTLLSGKLRTGNKIRRLANLKPSPNPPRNAIPAMPAMIGNARCPAIAPACREH